MAVVISKVDDAMLAASLVGRDELVMNVPRSHVLVVSLAILHLPGHIEFSQIILLLRRKHG